MKAEYIVGAVVFGLVATGLAFLYSAPAPSFSVPQSAEPSVAATSTQHGTALSPTRVPSQKKPVRKGIPYTDIVNPSGFVNVIS